MTDTTDIVARLRDIETALLYGPDQISHGDRVDWAPINRAAADRITALEDDTARLHKLATDRFEKITALEAEVAMLRGALEPFARAAEIKLCGGDFWTDDKFIQNTDVAFHVRFGDLRRARAALEGQS